MAADNRSDFSIVECGSRCVSISRVRGDQVHTRHVERGDWTIGDADFTAAVQRASGKVSAKGGDAVVLMPRALATVRRLQLPSTDLNEIAGMIALRATDFVPYPSEDIASVARLLGETESGQGDVLATMAQQGQIERIVTACADAGLRVVAVHSTTVALMDACAPASESEVVVRVAGDGVEMLVLEDGTYSFGRGIELDAEPDADEIAAELRESVALYERERGHSVPERWTLFAEGQTDATELSTAMGHPIQFRADGSDAFASACNRLHGIGLLPSRIAAGQVARDSFRSLGKVGAALIVSLALLAAGFWLREAPRNAYVRELEARIAELESAEEADRAWFVRAQAIRRHMDDRQIPLEILGATAGLASESQVSLTRFEFRANQSAHIQGNAKDYREFEALADGLREVGSLTLPLLAGAHEMYRGQTNFQGNPAWDFAIAIPLQKAEQADNDR